MMFRILDMILWVILIAVILASIMAGLIVLSALFTAGVYLIFESVFDILFNLGYPWSIT